MQFQENYFNEINQELAPNFKFDANQNIIGINSPLVISDHKKKILLLCLWKIQKNRNFILSFYSDIENKTNQVHKNILSELEHQSIYSSARCCAAVQGLSKRDIIHRNLTTSPPGSAQVVVVVRCRPKGDSVLQMRGHTLIRVFTALKVKVKFQMESPDLSISVERLGIR